MRAAKGRKGGGGKCPPVFFLHKNCFVLATWWKPVPVAARPKTQVCSRSPAETVGSNPTGGMDVSVVSVVCCQVEVSATN